MSSYKVHTLESAPEQSRSALKRLKESVGMIPNLAGAMAESPVLIEGFASLREIFRNGTFTPVEREILALTNAVENGCGYCVAIHSAFALKEGADRQVVDAIRAGRLPEEARLKALASFSRKLIERRGRVGTADIDEFVEAGYSRAQALEVVAGVASSVLANYGYHLTRAPLDEPLKPMAWTRD
jgi:uncharacterized peroxidase-related enzyme